MIAHLHQAASLALLATTLLVAVRVGVPLARWCWYMPWRDRAAWRYLPAALWARWRWHRLSRALGLTWTDRESSTMIARRSFAPMAAFLRLRVEKSKDSRVRYAPMLITPDAYGLVARLDTVPGVDREKVTKAAEHIRNAWKCHRVQVFQPGPGRLAIRGLRQDPLTTAHPAVEAPYELATPTRVYLGRDEWGRSRWLDLRGITGVTVGGLPRFGKSALTNGILYQLERFSEVQFAVIDGKDGNDYDEHAARVVKHVGDDLEECEAVIDWALGVMSDRQHTVRQSLGAKNGWDVGPSAEWPVVVIIMDECHTFFDLEGCKGDKRATERVQRIRSKVTSLVKKAGSVMMMVILITQKQTGDAVPTAIRDNCTVGLSFATKTRDASVAALGEGIRDWPGMCPTTLRRRPDYVGVCTASLPDCDVEEPFVRLRVPYLPDSWSERRATETAHLMTDPAGLVAQVPDNVAELIPAPRAPIDA